MSYLYRNEYRLTVLEIHCFLGVSIEYYLLFPPKPRTPIFFLFSHASPTFLPSPPTPPATFLLFPPPRTASPSPSPAPPNTSSNPPPILSFLPFPFFFPSIGNLTNLNSSYSFLSLSFSASRPLSPLPAPIEGSATGAVDSSSRTKASSMLFLRLRCASLDGPEVVGNAVGVMRGGR